MKDIRVINRAALTLALTALYDTRIEGDVAVRRGKAIQAIAHLADGLGFDGQAMIRDIEVIPHSARRRNSPLWREEEPGLD